MADIRVVEINFVVPPRSVLIDEPEIRILARDVAVTLSPAQDTRVINKVSFNVSTFN